MKFSDIPQFTKQAGYTVDVSWQYLVSEWLPQQLEDGLDVDPDFQRGHVWDESQQRRYIEFVLRGGRTGREIQTNHPGWHSYKSGAGVHYVLVDGKQRLAAVEKFMANNLRVFPEFTADGYGMYLDEFHGSMRHYACFQWSVNDLQTRAEVLQWYLDLNAGGVIHTDEEIRRVRELLATEKGK